MSSNLTWQQVYDFPLSLDSCGSYVWSASGVMALQFKGVIKEDRQKIIDSINGESILKIKDIANDGCDFYINGELAFYVRGWGYLTGTGALNLPSDKALEIQNGFIDHVLKSLKIVA